MEELELTDEYKQRLERFKFQKSKGELGVYRRQLGYACIVVGLLLTILSGFDFYTIDSSIIWPPFTTGAALLGIGIVKDYTEIKYGNHENKYIK